MFSPSVLFCKIATSSFPEFLSVVEIFPTAIVNRRVQLSTGGYHFCVNRVFRYRYENKTKTKKKLAIF